MTWEQVEKFKRVRSIVQQIRDLILADVELEIGDSPRWPHVRSRLLKYLGDRGLEGRIVEVLKENSL